MNGWSGHQRTWPVLAICLLATQAAPADAAGSGQSPTPDLRVVGFRGDGSGYFKNCNPPTEWDDATGRNIVWKTPLPNWGNNSPIVINGKAFVVCEPGYKPDFPVLVCVDIREGKIAWTAELDHINQLPSARQQDIRAAWREFLDFLRQCRRWRYAYYFENKKDEAKKWFADHTDWAPEARGKLGKPDDDDDDDQRGMAEALGRGSNKPDPHFKQVMETMHEANLAVDTWYGMGCTFIGTAFPTPVSDGRVVCAITAFNAAFCLDMDGKLLWKRWLGPYETNKKGKPVILASDQYCNTPLLIGNLLYMDIGKTARGLDLRTGKTLWETELSPKGGRFVGSARWLRLQGENYVLSTTGDLMRLSDGRRMAGGIGWAWSFGFAYDGANTVYCLNERGDGSGFFAPKSRGVSPGLQATQLILESQDQLAQKILFTTEVHASNKDGGLVLYKGLLYSNNGIYGAPDGARIGAVRKGASVASAHQLTAAGDYLYAFDRNGKCSIYRLDRTASLVRNNLCLLPAKPEGEVLERRKAITGMNTWSASKTGYSCPFFEGRRMYVRTHDFLYCIEQK